MCNYSKALLYYYVDAVFYNSLFIYYPAFGTYEDVLLIISSLKILIISSNIFSVFNKVGFVGLSLSVF